MQRMARAVSIAIVVLVGDGCAHGVARVDPGGLNEEGLASWYGAELAGRLTANGERFDPAAMTAAHRTLAFNTCVRVTLVSTGRVIEVRINDRGPFVGGRIIDLSEAAARALGTQSQAPAPVQLSRCESRR